MESLDVYLNGVRAGRLDDDNGMLSFAYCDSFLRMAVVSRCPIRFR